MSLSNQDSNIINKLLVENQHFINLNTYNNSNLIQHTYTTILENTIITYNYDIKVLFCANCSRNLTIENYIKHLKKFHLDIFNNYQENNIINVLKNKVNTLEYNNIEILKTVLEPNKYYFKELPLIFNNFKCLDCDYININYKEIRKHYNKNHSSFNSRTTKKVNYIINKVPLQLLEGFKDNKKIYFIPKLPTNNNKSKNYNNNNIETEFNLETSSISSDNSENTNNSNSSNIENNNIDLIINKYLEKENNKAKDFTFNNPDEGNTKLINSFIKKSNIYEFLENKNRDILVNLITNLEEDLNLSVFTFINYNELEEIILQYLKEIHSHINKIPLRLRHRLMHENPNKPLTDFKDFQALENKYNITQYLNYFVKLLIFIIRVIYIQDNYINSLNTLELEYYNTLKTLVFLQI